MRLETAAVLFDIDGTLIDSTPAVVGAWTSWAEHYDVDVREILAISHGRRSVDVIAMFVPPEEQARAHALMSELEYDGMETVVALPGVARLLAELPADRWAAVTSGESALMRARLAAAGLPAPAVLIGADQVERGKPDPEGYLQAAARLGVEAADCVVVEDAPAGIEAGRAAGATVIGVATSHEIGELGAADVVLPDLARLRAAVAGGRLVLNMGLDMGLPTA